MSGMSVPERPLQPPHDLGAEWEAFDEYDDDHMKQLFPHDESMARAVQELLLLRRSIHMTEASFGVDPLKALTMMREDLNRLHEACKDKWRDL